MTTLSPQLQAALVAAVVAVVGIIVRDVGMKIWERRAEKTETAQEIFHKYSDPLASSATSLLWRLNEVINGEGRGAYLQVDAHSSKFAEYKRLSTFYRILTLLGWIRAFRRELSFLKATKSEDIATIRSAISDLESALADGAHVEGRRLVGLMQLWDLNTNNNESELIRIGIVVDQILSRELHAGQVIVASELSKDSQRNLCLELANKVSNELKVNPPGEEVVNETVARAVQCLSYREAWIYRDWQVGLGDLMLREMDKGPRMFDVIGFKDFETLVTEGSEIDKRWIGRVTAVFDNVDVSGADTYDVRLEQLRNTLRATANLLISLTNADNQQKILQEKSLELANQIVGQSE